MGDKGGCAIAALIIFLGLAFSAVLYYMAGRLAEYFGYPFWVGVVVLTLVNVVLGGVGRAAKS